MSTLGIDKNRFHQKALSRRNHKQEFMISSQKTKSTRRNEYYEEWKRQRTLQTQVLNSSESQYEETDTGQNTNIVVPILSPTNLLHSVLMKFK